MNNKITPTEKAPAISKSIDEMDIGNGINTLINDQMIATKAVMKASKQIMFAVEDIYSKLTIKKSNKIIYVGAGTSGRIAVQDGVELYPTFGWPRNRVEFIIAGGKEALTRSVEGAEDDVSKVKEIIKKKLITKNDVLIGLAASGNTPFTCNVMKHANFIGALTICISNNKDGDILNFCKHKIFLDTGPEIIIGSTRLKAGTAQKVCLNTISSMLMVKLGNVKKGHMINLIPTNKKLFKRKNRIIKELKLSK